MKTVVITGSTRGIGYGLAEAFLAAGCRVAVNGRTEEAVQQAVRRLSDPASGDRVAGRAGDVSEFRSVQRLWDFARDSFGAVHIWINNAGVAHAPLAPDDYDGMVIDSVISTNLIGAFNGAAVALTGFREQGFGALYNMEGLGSDGRKVGGMALYGATKYGLHYLTQALARETRGSGVIVGALRPGMVLTDLLLRPFDDRPEEWERVKRVFNLLAERVEVVAPFLVREILANRTNGRVIKYLTPGRLLLRLAGGVFRRRELLP